MGGQCDILSPQYMSNNRKALQASLGTNLEVGFSLSNDDYGDFVDYTCNKGSCRAIRIVGAKRYLVLFHHTSDVFAKAGCKPSYKMLYLNKDNELVEFDPKKIKQDAGPGASWERALSEWLASHGAASFTGRGWDGACACKLQNLTLRWKKRYSGGTYKTPLEETPLGEALLLRLR